MFDIVAKSIQWKAWTLLRPLYSQPPWSPLYSWDWRALYVHFLAASLQSGFGPISTTFESSILMTVRIAFLVPVEVSMASQAYLGRLKRSRAFVPDMEFCHVLPIVWWYVFYLSWCEPTHEGTDQVQNSLELEPWRCNNWTPYKGMAMITSIQVIPFHQALFANIPLAACCGWNHLGQQFNLQCEVASAFHAHPNLWSQALVALDLYISYRRWDSGRRDHTVVCWHLLQPGSSRANPAILVLMHQRPHRRDHCPWVYIAGHRCHCIHPPDSSYRES